MLKIALNLTLILSTLFLYGCRHETADWNTLAYQNGIIHKDNSPTPFTGIGYDKWENGQVRLRQPFVKGKEHGWTTTWYENGKKSSEGEWRNGEQVGVWTYWDRDGDESTVNRGE